MIERGARAPRFTLLLKIAGILEADLARLVEGTLYAEMVQLLQDTRKQPQRAPQTAPPGETATRP